MIFIKNPNSLDLIVGEGFDGNRNCSLSSADDYAA